MKHLHAKCLKAALEATRSQSLRQVTGDHFTATIDGAAFNAEDVHGFISFGVKIVVGVINDGNNRRYISVAADDDLGDGEHDVSLDGKVTIGYMVEIAGEPTLEYPADSGRAHVCCEGDQQAFSGSFNVKLIEVSPYKEIEATFKVTNLHRLA